MEVLGHNNAAAVSMPPHQPRPLPPSMSYPPSGLANNPFLASFASSSLPEPAAAGSGVCRDPMCRDPLCPTALRNQQQLNFTYSSLLASTPYYKEAIMAFTAAQQRMAAAAALAAAPPGSAGGALPYVCNWVSGKFLLLSGFSQYIPCTKAFLRPSSTLQVRNTADVDLPTPKSSSSTSRRTPIYPRQIQELCPF